MNLREHIRNNDQFQPGESPITREEFEDMLDAVKASPKTPTYQNEALPIMNGLFIPAHPIKNREAERAARKEMEKITMLLWPIEKEFVSRIQDPLDQEDYHFLYTKYLEWFLKTISQIEKTMKLQHFMVNKDYFIDNFRPDN